MEEALNIISKLKTKNIYICIKILNVQVSEISEFHIKVVKIKQYQ